MGHQLLLCSSIPHGKYMQTVLTLQALTGLRNPKSISTYSIVTRPHNVFRPKFEPGKVNQIEQYIMNCTTTWTDAASEELDLARPVTAELEINVDRLFSGKEVNTWTLHVSDMPNAGKSPVLAHNFYESTVVHHHTRGATPTLKEERKETVEEKAQTEVNEKEVEEEKVENGDVISLDSPMDIDKATVDQDGQNGQNGQNGKNAQNGQNGVAQNGNGQTEENSANANGQPSSGEAMDVDEKDSFLQFLEDFGYDVVNQFWLKGIRFFFGDIVIEIFKVFVRDDAADAPDGRIRLKLLDESNTFQIKTYINYPRNANLEHITKGTKELTKLKTTLLNLFELEVPDRMFMDSRVTRTT